MNIRPATADDANALARVHVDSWRSAYRGLVPDAYLENLDWEHGALRFRRAIVCGADETYVAEERHEMLGFLTVGACRDADVDPATTGEIWGIYLAPRHWRRGVGGQLCLHAERVLASRHYLQAVLWVLEGHAGARRFYEAMGFEVDGASKTLNPRAPLKAIRYRKQLKPAEPTCSATTAPPPH